MDLTRGRLAQKPFALGVTAVYIAGIGTHILLSSEVAGARLWLFIIAQAVLIGIWLVLHIRRLRDAGQGPAAATGVALVYVLSLGLLAMLVVFLTNAHADGAISAESSPSDAAAGTPVALFLLSILFKPDFGVFMTILKGLIAIAFLPAATSLIFSIHTGLRPRA